MDSHYPILCHYCAIRRSSVSSVPYFGIKKTSRHVVLLKNGFIKHVSSPRLVTVTKIDAKCSRSLAEHCLHCFVLCQQGAEMGVTYVKWLKWVKWTIPFAVSITHFQFHLNPSRQIRHKRVPQSSTSSS